MELPPRIHRENTSLLRVRRIKILKKRPLSERKCVEKKRFPIDSGYIK